MMEQWNVGSFVGVAVEQNPVIPIFQHERLASLRVPYSAAKAKSITRPPAPNNQQLITDNQQP
jgi:hypothetical protein